jgi:hypothetical protein
MGNSSLGMSLFRTDVPVACIPSLKRALYWTYVTQGQAYLQWERVSNIRRQDNHIKEIPEIRKTKNQLTDNNICNMLLQLQLCDWKRTEMQLRKAFDNRQGLFIHITSETWCPWKSSTECLRTSKMGSRKSRLSNHIHQWDEHIKEGETDWGCRHRFRNNRRK